MALFLPPKAGFSAGFNLRRTQSTPQAKYLVSRLRRDSAKNCSFPHNVRNNEKYDLKLWILN
jgi:hypothetical protein